jgi:hypothetical protein
MINFKPHKHHWNYFIALERDLDNVSRFVEFSEDNLATYSIEFTHLLLASSSEVDVLMQQICAILHPGKSFDNMDDYRVVVKRDLNSMINEKVIINGFGMTFEPWINWNNDTNPDWWRFHNKVKHERHNFFREANLKNTLNSMGGLLIAMIYYYKLAFSKESGSDISFRDTTFQLQPESSLMKIDADYYFDTLVC